MKNVIIIFTTVFLFLGCSNPKEENIVKNEPVDSSEHQDKFKWQTETFADKKIVRYKINGWDKLSLDQKKLVYYLSQAGHYGRDIIYDQNYKHNLAIKRACEQILRSGSTDKSSADWEAFNVYLKNIWFSNGIHHHYSNSKFTPGFSKEFFLKALTDSGAKLSKEAIQSIFDENFNAKKVSLDSDKDLIKSSAINLYGKGISQNEVEDFYKNKIIKTDTPISYGLNSKVVKDKNGKLTEKTYKVGGLYGKAIEKISYWIGKAAEVAENKAQGDALLLLKKYYETGDLKIWDDYNIAWCKATEGDIDYINGFIEVYNDPLGYKGSFETIVQIKDFEASERMAKLSENAQWFEDNSSIESSHKKENVVGVSYKVVTVAAEAGDASPSTPIGVNLPNSDWIRAKHGSKSVSLGNIISAYEEASGSGSLNEFAHDKEEIELSKAYGTLADKMATALHEVIGHASGKINPGIGTPKETLKSYASTLEEARADIVAMYFITHPKLTELGLMPSPEAGRTEYDAYIRAGLMTQLKRIKPGDIIEESHMRNRQLIASWAFEMGRKENVIAKIKKNGKTYFDIQDYNKLRMIFGEQLKELQRIKSEGDYDAGKQLVETYGVQVDPELHKEVLERVQKLNTAPYGGFINPELIPVKDTEGNITDIKVEYPDDFQTQMLDYSKKYTTLPDYN